MTTYDSNIEEKYKAILASETSITLRNDLMEEIANELTPSDRSVVVNVMQKFRDKIEDSKKEVLAGL